MKILVIGHEDAVRGFALVGVHGQIVTTVDDLMPALNAAMDDESVGIILLTEDVADLARERVDHIKAHSSAPLLVEIPGPEGPHPDRPSLRDMIRKRTGVRL